MPSDSVSKAAVNTLSRASGPAVLSAAIEESARQLTFGALLYRLLYLLAAIIAFPLLVVIGDHAIAGGLPRPLIFGAGILWGLVSVLATMGVSLRTLLRRLNRVFVARHVERSRGITHNPLINMVLLQRSSGADYARDVAAQQAAAVLANADPDAPGSGVSLRRPGLFLLTAIGVWLLYSAITPKPILPSLARLFGASRHAPTATRLELLRPRPDEPVYVGQPLEFVFAVSGRPVTRVRFELLDPAARDAPPLLRSDLEPDLRSDRPARYRISLAAHEVGGDLHYRCTAGDAWLDGVIAVLPQPDLLALEIELVPPAYVGEPAQRTSEPDLRVWAGTRATFRALANTEMRDPVFVFRSLGEIRTRMSVEPADPRHARLSLSLTESGEYWLEFSDRRGRSCCDPMTHRIVVRHDSPPRVEIITPSREETPSNVVDVTHTAWLRAVAADDVRLDALFFVRDDDGTVNRTKPLDWQPTGPNRDIEVGVPTSNLALEVGQSLSVWFEARDNRVSLDGTPAPQTTTSRELLLIRMPEVIPEQLGEEAYPQDLADAVGTTERIVKRRQARPGDESEPGDAADVPGEDDDGPVGPDPIGTKYRPAPGGEADGETTDDAEPPPEINPEDVVRGGDTDDTPQGSTEQADESNDRDAAERNFDDQLRRFNQEHGDEAREVNQRIGRQNDNADGDLSESTRSGEDGQGGGGADDSPEEAAQSDTRGGPNSNDQAASRPDDAEELEEQPESQPSEPRQTESKPPQQEDEAEQVLEPRSDKEEEQEADRPRKPEDQPQSEDAASQADGRKSEEQDEQDASKQDEQQPTAEPDADQDRQGQGDQPQPQQQSGSGAEPDDQQTERVIPMPDAGQSPQAEPPSEPEAPANQADAGDATETDRRTDATDTLELLARGEDISEEDLLDFGWPPEKRRAFIESFERLRESARRAGILARPAQWWRSHADLGSSQVTPGSGWSQGISTGVASGTAVRDGLEQIAPPTEQRIAPELRAILDAYYRSLAEKRTERPAPPRPNAP